MQNKPPSLAEDTPSTADEATALRAAATRSRRSFLGLGLASVAGLAGWRYLLHTPDADGMPGALRQVLDFNGRLSSAYYCTTRLAPEFARSRARMPRANGRYGLRGENFDPATWHLTVQGYGPTGQAQSFSLAQIKALTRTEFTTELKCIEGWSTVVTWAGVRFVDFLAQFPLATRSGQPIANGGAPPPDTAPYVSLVTPDKEYYVGLDMASALHPQTLLCYEMNGQPLTLPHGAPLRLVTPLKYGIKHLKRIGTISFANTRPADYWAKKGYDWDAGH